MHAHLYSIHEELSSGKLSILARPRGGDWLFDEIKALHEADVDVLVSLLTPSEVSELDLTEEATACSNQGMTYFSFPITDFSVPPFSTPTFTFLEQLRSYLSEGKHVAIHCRQGLGRAPLIAAGVLVLSGFAPGQAFALLSKARGYTVPETEEQKAWVVAFSQYHSRSLH
jgi:protein-tyrosine phosphatase